MRRWEIIAIVGILAVVLAAAAGGAYRGYPNPTTSSSFGPDWYCPVMPYATVCIKRVPAPSEKPP